VEVSIERNDCISCGLCAETCPDVFRIADDGLAEVHRQPNAALADSAKEAAANCPVSVIYVE
jgi:ferredoxin